MSRAHAVHARPDMSWGTKNVAFAALISAVGSGLGCTTAPLDAGGGPAGYLPPPAVLPRLTATQYRNTLVDLFGATLPATPAPADSDPYLFYSIGATSTELSALGVQQYADAAATVADWLVADPTRAAAVLGCAPAAPDDPCLQTLLGDLGLRLFRRPLAADELAAWTEVVTDTARGNALRGLRMALYGMLQSPQFLYRSEIGEPDPGAPERFRYTSYEMAERLSFLLWDTSPDLELLGAAERGELVTEAGIYDQAARLLESPRARGAVQAFFGQYLDLGRLEGFERDPVIYPSFSPTLAESMKNEIRLLVDDHVFRSDDDIRELFSSRTTFVNAELAALYGVEAVGATEIAFVPVELPEDGPRAGILTSAALLAMNSHETQTSPTLRGKFLRERVLCQTVPPPADDVDLTIDEPSEEAHTLRERLAQHLTDESCAGCHSFIDPPGFLFESFDAIGAFRTEDNGYPVDTSGDLDGVPLANARDLAAALADDKRVAACLVKQVYRHASGRLEQPVETPLIEALGESFAESGYRFKDLLLELAVSPAFRTVAKEVLP
jgi:hypothetical protein